MEKRLLQINDLNNLQVLQDPDLSPDGRSVAFVSKTITEEDEYISHLFVHSLEDKNSTQWTFGKGTVHTPRYSPDGRWIAFSAVRNGSASQIYVISTNGGEAKQVTHLPKGASQPFWTGDSAEIIFSATNTPGDDPHEEKTPSQKSQPLVVERLKYKADASGFLSEDRKQIGVFSMISAEVHLLTDEGFDLELADVSTDGQTIVYTANKEDDRRIGSDMYLLHRNENIHVKLLSGTFTQASFSPDNKQIAVYGHEQEFKGATQTNIWLYDLSSEEAVCLTHQKDIGFTDTMIGDIRGGMSNPGPFWNQDGSAVYAAGSEHGATNLFRISTKGEIVQKSFGSQHVFAVTISQATGAAVIGISTPTDPGELYEGSAENTEWSPLTHFNDHLKEEVTLYEPEEYWIKAEDGLDIQGWVIAPPADSPKPGLLEIHGGPHAMYGATFFHEIQLLAAQGYAVFYCNPRGSHGYGQDFVNAVRGDYGGKDYTDIMSFTDAVLEAYPGIDPERLGVTGGSYGGFMTNWIVSHNNRFKAAATLRCISNWTSFYGVSDIGYFFTEWEVGADLLEDPDKLWEHSPLKYAANIHTPLLIMHGEKDFRCPIEQAEQLFVSLKQLGRETRFVRFPDANHELSRSGPPHLRKARLKELTSWFEKL